MRWLCVLVVVAMVGRADADVMRTMGARAVEAARQVRAAVPSAAGLCRWQVAGAQRGARGLRDPEASVGDGATPPTPVPLSADALRLLAQLDDARTGPCAADVPSLAFVRALVYQAFAHADEAELLYADLVTHHAEHPTALYAANRLIDLAIIGQRYDRMTDWAYWVIDRPSFAIACAGQDRRDLVERAVAITSKTMRHYTPAIPTAAEALADGDRAYATHLAIPAESPRHAQLLYDAVRGYAWGGAVARATEVLAELRAWYPHSPQAVWALGELSALYERTGIFPLALDLDASRAAPRD